MKSRFGHRVEARTFLFAPGRAASAQRPASSFEGGGGGHMPSHWAETFLSEVLGTGILILLGDGVVAGVLLAKSKAQNSGWIVITMAWAFAVFCGRPRCGSGQRCPPQPSRHPRGRPERRRSDGTWRSVYWAGEMVGAFIGAVLVFLHYYPHWAETEDAGPQARCLLHCARDPQPRSGTSLARSSARSS